MLAKLSLTLLFGLIQFSGAELPDVSLSEDEFVLPPYLMRFEGGLAMNVTTGTYRHAVAPGEWLDLDDVFDLPDRLAAQVLVHENLQWVGGGVLKLAIEHRVWKRPMPPTRFDLSHGMFAVWVKTSDSEKGIEIKTPRETFAAQDAVFWLSVQGRTTELYLQSGTVKDSRGNTWNKKIYVNYKPTGEATSKAWDVEPYKVHIGALYPSMLKLIEAAEKDWKLGNVKKTYAKIRKQGWRKKLRKDK